MSGSPAEEQARARVHQTLLGSWRLDRFLSLDKGITSYEATDAAGRRGLVKLLHAEPSRHADTLGRFFRESRIAGLVRHPQVIEALAEGWTEDGCACAVVRLMDGATCKAVAEDRPEKRLDVDEVLHIAERALEGLSALHGRGVLHANLKPEKLFWTRDGDVVVVGLGDARLFGPKKPDIDLPEPKSVGTAAFMPPEQALGEWERLDARSDLWALGATLFTLLTGQLVRRERNSQQQLLAAMTKPAPKLASVAPDMPEGLCGVVDGALAFDPKARWPHSRAMLQAVRMLRTEVAGTVAAPGATAPFQPGSLPFHSGGAAPTAVPTGARAAPPASVATGTLHVASTARGPDLPFGDSAARRAEPEPPRAVAPPIEPAAAAGPSVAATIAHAGLAPGLHLPFRSGAGPVALAETPPPPRQPPSTRMDTGTLHGDRAMGRPLLPFGREAVRAEIPAPYMPVAGHARSSPVAAEPFAAAAPEPAPAEALVETYAQLKVAMWSDPASFLEKLRARGLDEIRWRVSEARLAETLDREAAAGTSATARRLAEAMHMAARSAEG